jgi:methyl-accepting chemotaxis protein
MRSRKRKWLINGMVTLALFIGIAFGISKAAETKPDLKKVDIIGRLKKINENNSSLGQVNKDIVKSMASVDKQVEKTGEVARKLTEVQKGLGVQKGSLDRLVPVAAEQVTLGTNLRNLSSGINKNMGAISSTSAKQNEELKRMNQVVQDAQGKLNSVVKGNQAINEKLGKAADKSNKINQAIP